MTTPDAVPTIDASKAARLVDSGEILLLDVREADQWAAGHAPSAVLVPLGELGPFDVPANQPVVTLCRSGNRSVRATVLLAAAGYDVRNLTGGLLAWAAAGLPVVQADGAAGKVI